MTALRSFSSSLQDPNQPADPNAQQTSNQSTDPNAQQDPNQTTDPNAQQTPNQSTDPNAQQDPNQTTDPNAQQDPNATSPGGVPVPIQTGSTLDSLVGTKVFLDVPEIKFVDLSKSCKYLTGGVKLKSEITLEVVPKGGSSPLKGGATTNQGVKVDVELAKQKDVEVFGLVDFDEVKETITCEGSAKQIDVTIGITAKRIFSKEFDFVSGILSGKFCVLKAKWEDLSKNPDNFTLTQVAFEAGLQGEGTIPLDGVDAKDLGLKITAKAVGSASIGPNWPNILIEVGKKVVTSGGGPAIGVVGGIFGGLALCAGVCAAIGKLQDFGQDATAVCQDGANQLNDYAASYASTMQGKPGKDARGNQDAEDRLQKIMSAGGMTHDEAVEQAVIQVKESNHNYGDDAYRALLPVMREQITKKYKEKEGVFGNLFSGNVLEQVMNDVLPADGHFHG